jgi:drug/metabolite transporter superfamily protein YnfA
MKARPYIEDPPPSNGRPLREIFRDIINHIAEIVRSEIRLATLEIRDEVASLKMAVISIAIGAMLAAYGGVFLLLGLAYAVSTVWPAWLAAVAVGAAVALVGGIVVSLGVKRLKRPKLK